MSNFQLGSPKKKKKRELERERTQNHKKKMLQIIPQKYKEF